MTLSPTVDEVHMRNMTISVGCFCGQFTPELVRDSLLLQGL